MFLNVSKQNFSHTSRAHISKRKRCFDVKSSTYYFHMKTKISTDFHIKPYNCSSLLSINNSIILRHGNNIMISVISHQEIVIQALSIPSYLDEELPCWFFLLLMLYDWFLNYFLLFLHPLMIWENIKSVK